MKRAASSLLGLLALAASACVSAAAPPASAPPPPEAPAPPPPPREAAAVPLDLPTASSWAGVEQTLVVDLRADGTMFANGERIDADGELLVQARLALRAHPEARAILRADSSVPYGRVVHALDLLKQAGIAKIAFGVQAAASPDAEVAAAPPPAAPQAPTRAGLLPGTSWRCPFPAEADRAKIDDAMVVLEVMVGADGTPTGTRVLADPGHGFREAAMTCAMARKYASATDEHGAPVAGKTPPIRVRFER